MGSKDFPLDLINKEVGELFQPIKNPVVKSFDCKKYSGEIKIPKEMIKEYWKSFASDCTGDKNVS